MLERAHGDLVGALRGRMREVELQSGRRATSSTATSAAIGRCRSGHAGRTDWASRGLNPTPQTLVPPVTVTPRSPGF